MKSRKKFHELGQQVRPVIGRQAVLRSVRRHIACRARNKASGSMRDPSAWPLTSDGGGEAPASVARWCELNVDGGVVRRLLEGHRPAELDVASLDRLVGPG